MSSKIDLDNLTYLKGIKSYREFVEKEFLNILESVSGKKAIIIDPDLVGALSLILEIPVLKEHNVDKLIPLSSEPFKTQIKKLVFLVRPQMSSMKKVADQIIQHEQNQTKKDSVEQNFYVFFVPRVTIICKKILEQLGVSGSVIYGEFHLDLIPFDEDVYSLANEKAFRDFVLGDISSLYYISRALVNIQSFIGIIPEIYYMGKHSKILSEMLLRMRQESDLDDSLTPQVKYLVIVDRENDLLTPMVTQLNYEGMIDELYGISHTLVELDPNVLGKEGKIEKEKAILNSNDLLFSELRDLNMALVSPFLVKKARSVSSQYDTRKQARNIGDLKNFIKKLPNIQREHASLGTHVSLTMDIGAKTTGNSDFLERLDYELNLLVESQQCDDYIEDCIAQQKDLISVLRILCLQSMVIGGFKNKKFDFFRNEIIQTYGYRHVFTLDSLEQLGMLKKSEGRSKRGFAQIRKSLDLIDENYENTKHFSSVHSGYAPQIIKLVQILFNSNQGYNVFKDLANNFYTPDVGRKRQEISIQAKEEMKENTEKHVCMVFFVGGVTFAEISAIRILNQMEQTGVHFVIGTTHITNGNKIIESTFEKVEDNILQKKKDEFLRNKKIRLREKQQEQLQKQLLKKEKQEKGKKKN
ncbi:vacuolar protein sorting-associated protein 33a [Anaeramoeba flamelloides]|uniref:Vacuolar protein sorting-associated protein 33a n=1 Tax=Anaeramoeba flamelloides TaxID=1746091 RepID=A0AAV7Z6S9_9EUKA|nr:vacuolar protein sorting-associated protein 33a [Anaeramoeba flamelloides]KAJ6233692.1 vacuolar protein sorting-associated protein 33a [Anaeramoeba flamelloides]